jgi:hypothetical protein
MILGGANDEVGHGTAEKFAGTKVCHLRARAGLVELYDRVNENFRRANAPGF